MKLTRKASEKGRIRLSGLDPNAAYTVTVEPAVPALPALPEGTRLVTDEELTWAEKPDKYWWSAKENPRWRTDGAGSRWEAFNDYAIPTDTVLRPFLEPGYRHVTDEERRTRAKPACTRVWLNYSREWRNADSQGWKGKYNYSIPADHVWAEDAPKMVQATDEVRRKYEMPEEEWASCDYAEAEQWRKRCLTGSIGLEGPWTEWQEGKELASFGGRYQYAYRKRKTPTQLVPWEREDVPFHPGEAYLVSHDGHEMLAGQIDELGIRGTCGYRWSYTVLLKDRWKWAKCNSNDTPQPCGKEA